MGKWYHPIKEAHGFSERGIASWYGRKFHGRKTANGETYNMYGISAAHKILPLGTVVEVKNLRNNRKLTVRINDRGPFVTNRIIDLSYSAAQKLGIVGPGTAPVEIVALGTPVASDAGTGKPRYLPVDVNSGNFTFQVGAFRSYENAFRLKEKLGRTYQNAHMATYDGPDGRLYRVRVGRFRTLQQAAEGERLLIDSGISRPFLVAE